MERSGDGWQGRVYGQAPVQGTGIVDGLPWYFRAKHDEWSFVLAGSPSADPLEVGASESGWSAGEPYGGRFEASYMPESVAWEFIEQCIAKHRRGELRPALSQP